MPAPDAADPVLSDVSVSSVIGERLQEASDWFTTADVLGDEMVPAVADWCAVHVRATVVQALRAGVAVPLAELGPRPAGRRRAVGNDHLAAP